MVFFFRNGTSKGNESNPFDEEEWDEGDNEALVDNGEPGVPVKALYDYEGAESDELSFKQGELTFDSTKNQTVSDLPDVLRNFLYKLFAFVCD